MSAFYLLFLFGLWVVLVFWLSRVIAKILLESKWRPIVGIVLFTILLPLPFIDELIGKWQFERLCQENSTIYIAPDAKGRTVYLASGTPEEAVKGTWGVHIWLQPYRLVDATTGETIVSYNNLRASRGWFVRKFLSFMGGPMLFKGSYQPPNAPVNEKMFEKIGINYIERPEHKQGESK